MKLNLNPFYLQIRIPNLLFVFLRLAMEESIPSRRRHLFSTEFPTTPEEFDRVEVLCTFFVRIDLVRWVNAMFKKYPYTNGQLDNEMLTYYTKIMNHSFDRINYLYKIQAAYNLSLKVSINVKPGNYYYDILIKAHELWTSLTKQFVNIIIQTSVIRNIRYLLDDLDGFLALPDQAAPNYNKGKEIMDLIIKSENIDF